MYLLVHNNGFQRSKYLTVFQEIAGKVYSVSNSVQSYLNLKATNVDLMKRIATLEEEIQGYKKVLETISDRMHPDSIKIGTNQTNYHLIPARINKNQVSETNNYIVLDKGSKSGIAEDMAVVSVKGIVGIVMKVTPNYSRVIPVINSEFHTSLMIKNSSFFGISLWDGKDPRYISLINLPSHASHAIGDTIVTSGYSDAFPEGVPVGIIEGTYKQKNEEYNSLKVRLFIDFSTLREVLIISNPFREEQLQIEKGIGE